MARLVRARHARHGSFRRGRRAARELLVAATLKARDGQARHGKALLGVALEARMAAFGWGIGNAGRRLGRVARGVAGKAGKRRNAAGDGVARRGISPRNMPNKLLYYLG
jgi:hypothetical protein